MDREDKNINAAVRVSQVHNIDEEKLKFKVNVGISNHSQNHGDYSFDLPPLTDLCNSNEYSQAIIKLDQIVISPFSRSVAGVVSANPNPVWSDRFQTGVGPGATLVAISNVLLTMSIPSRQTGLTSNNNDNNNIQYGQLYYKYQELIPTFWEWRGNYEGIQTTNNNPPVAVGNSYAIKHKPNSDNGVMCANPFGSRVNFSFILGQDVGEDQNKIYLADVADPLVPRNDITDIAMQLSIILVPNK
mgnify:CR=1 FL=1|tara:strand:+ start:541 stop:1272 length:732 start_codon:yes stop_codon:yes gene_type:complete